MLLAMVGGCGPGDDRETRQDDQLTLSVVGTNDVHGRILATDGAGGLAVFGGYLANLRDARRRDGGAVLLIDAGDMWQGTLESNIAEGAPVVAAYNALGYAAATIGNHEFDFGPSGPAAMPESDADDARGALKARASEANFPFLSANLVDEDTGDPVNWPNVSPNHTVNVSGIDVGIIGLTSASTLRTTHSANVVGLRIASLAETIVSEATRLRTGGARMIIVTAHAGGECSRFEDPLDLSSCDAESEIFRVARALPRGLVNLIVGGHVHKGIAHEVNGIPIISSWSGGSFFGRVDFGITDGQVSGHRIFKPTRICQFIDAASGTCAPSGETAGSAAATYEGSIVEPDEAVAIVLEPAIAAAAALKSETLGPVLETPFRRRPDPESPIGNLLTDILLASEPDADVAIHNTLGGIRADLPAGELTYGSVYEMFPFDNRIIHLVLTGAELRAVFANQVAGPSRRGNVSGVRVIASCSGDQLRIAIHDARGREIDDDEELLVVSNDFLATGGDGILTPAMPGDGLQVRYEGPLVRDIIVQWMRRHSVKMSEDQFIDPLAPRWSLPKPAPVKCP